MQLEWSECKNIPYMLPPPHPTEESRPALLKLYSICRLFQEQHKGLMQMSMRVYIYMHNAI